jgi:hypothetical protein
MGWISPFNQNDPLPFHLDDDIDRRDWVSVNLNLTLAFRASNRFSRHMILSGAAVCGNPILQVAFFDLDPLICLVTGNW